jgi:hypothetical protein
MMKVGMPRPLNQVSTRRLRQPWLKSLHQSVSLRDEQIELLRLLVANSNRNDTVVINARDQARSSYVEFLATHPPTFTELSGPLEADQWPHTVESKFDLLNCTENQKIQEPTRCIKI